MAMALQLKPKSTIFRANPSFAIRFSSSSSDNNNNGGEEDKTTESRPPSFTSHFNDVKSTLPQSSQSPSPIRRLSQQSPLGLEDIRKNLSSFRNLSAPPLPQSPPSKTVSFSSLYKSNVTVKVQFDSIRESLRNYRGNTNLQQGQWGQKGNGPVMRGTVLGKKNNGEEEEKEKENELVKSYTYDELGQKLKLLRPAAGERKIGENWFSLTELNERLKKLKEIEEKEAQQMSVGGLNFDDLRKNLKTPRVGGINFDDLRKSLKMLSDPGNRKSSNIRDGPGRRG